MAERSDNQDNLAPAAPIRRFDVFAEYNRIKNEDKGMPADQAKGQALWLAKLVAARKFARTAEKRAEVSRQLGQPREPSTTGYRQLNGVPQTAELFDREVAQRMGLDFYHQVFSPGIAAAVSRRESYEDMRDHPRAEWNLRRLARHS